ANRGKPARHCEAHSPAGERHGGRASRGRGRHGNEGPGGATAGDDRKMNNEPLEREPMNNEPREREPIDRVRARLEALLKANAAPRCGGYGPHRTIYLTGIDANNKVAESFRAQGVQGADAFASPGAEIDWSCEDQADWSKGVDMAVGGGS